jgi:hypothetical protein
VREPVTGLGVAEGEAVLVGDPLLVDLGVVARKAAHHLAASVVDTDGGSARVVLRDRGAGDQVEGAGAEAVIGAGEGTHRADLDGVAGEVGLEGLLLVDADLLQRTALDQRDERVTGDLLGEPRAAGAQHAALTIEQHLRRDVDRLGEGPLDALEAALAAAVGHRLVLQRALAALVADRAVERVVDQQELHDPLLGLVGDLAGDLGVDDHALGDRQGAGGLRLGEAAAVAGVRHLHEALPAGADRRQQRVVAEPWDLGADLLGGPDHQGVPGDAHLDAVDRDADQADLLLRRGAHALAPAAAGALVVAKAVAAAGSSGQPPWARWAR